MARTAEHLQADLAMAEAQLRRTTSRQKAQFARERIAYLRGELGLQLKIELQSSYGARESKCPRCGRRYLHCRSQCIDCGSMCDMVR
jgi:hypothetical protein